MSRQTIEKSPLQALSLALFLGLFLAWERAPFFLVPAALFFLRHRRWLGLGLLGAAFAYGWFKFTFPVPFPELSFPLRTQAVVKILEPSLERENFSYALAELKRLGPKKPQLKTLVELYFHPARDFEPGTILKIEGLFKLLGGTRNPFSYDFQRVKMSRRIFLRARVSQVEVLAIKPSFLGHLRKNLFRFAARLSPEARGLFEALVLGTRFHLPLKLREKFERQGTFHFLAISGMHLGLLVGVFWLMIKLAARFYPNLFLYLPEKNLVFFSSAPFVLLYTLLSGPTPSALRAFVMFGTFTLALGLYREARTLDILALAVFLILLLRPESVGDLSFRLSVSAVGAIIIAARIKSSWPWPRRLWRYPLEVFFFSAVASLATFPWLLGLKGEIALTSPLYNLWLTPLFAFFVLPLEFLAASLALIFPSLATKLAEMAGHLVSFLPTGPALSFHPPYPLGAFLLAFLPLSLPLFFWRKGAFFVGLFLSLILHFYFWSKSPPLFLLFDVGQGSAAFLKVKDQTLLFDTGPKFGRYDAGRFVVCPTLKKLGLGQIDKVVISHPQADHLGGLSYLRKHLRLKEIVSSFPLPFPTRLIRKSQREKDGALTLDFYPSQGDPNEASLVTRACLDALCFLFPGDIGFQRERRLLEEKRPLKAQILLLPHHGSRWSGSFSFLKEVSPKLALSSSRRSYHPAPQTLKRLRLLGIPHLGTKENGALSLLWKKEFFLCTEKARRRESLLKRALWPYWPTGCERWTP